MNQGARDMNDASREYSERLHRERVEALLVEIRDLLKPPSIRFIGQWEQPVSVGAVDPVGGSGQEGPRASKDSSS